ncbi:WD40/YVTN/BNR-like repeat-containing protein [Aliikangiella sp. IMCC44653]
MLFSVGATAEVTLNTRAVKAPERLLMDIKQVANKRLVAVGERGHIIVSDDLGESWSQKLVPTEALLTKLFFLDGQTGWAVGHEQNILFTNDAGETWTLQHASKNLDQPAFFDIWFKNKQQGIAIGAYGLYMQTENGGVTWEPVYQATLEDEEIGFPHFYSVAALDDGETLVMAGELGFLAISSDLGQNWRKLDSPYDGSFFNVQALNEQTLVIMGLRGHVFKSVNLGESWNQIETNTIAVLQESTKLADGRLLIVGTDGAQLISDDNGDSFKLSQRSDRVHLANAIALDQDTVLLVGIKGVLKTNFNEQ